jgi:hypothetical protein
MATKPGIASGVMSWLLTPPVRFTINLHHHAYGRAVEVGDVPAERVLTPELQAVRPLPQRLPKQSFR